ncbi:MAG: hypothetical protein ABIJ65_09915 [Chloroflexota bacterium]
MKNNKKNTFPWWLFALLAVGTLVACGIYLGIISREGATLVNVIKVAGFGITGLLMAWGALANR